MFNAAEHAHAADRFAREIVGILTRSGAARLRRLMRNPLGRRINGHKREINSCNGFTLRAYKASDKSVMP